MKYSIIAANTNRSFEYFKQLIKLQNSPKEIFIYSKIYKCKIINFLNEKKVRFQYIKSNDINSFKVRTTLIKSKTKNFIFSGYPAEIVSNKLINIKNFFHCHPGLLPQFRGSTTLFYSLILKKSIWCTVLQISKKIDDGKILYKKKFNKTKNLESINSIFDDKIRSLTFAEFIKRKKLIKFKINFGKNKVSNLYYIAHPIIRNLAIKKRDLRFINKFANKY